MKWLFSTKMSFVLLLAIIVAMAFATFIENDFGTLVARNRVYEAWWFELIMAWLAVNFIFHIGQYKLFSKRKLAVGLFHSAFVVIIIGAGVTRYFSREGVIHIREGQTQHIFYSAENYLQLTNSHDQHAFSHQEFIPKVFQPNEYPISIAGQNFVFKAEEYIKGAKQGYGPGDQTLMEITALDGGIRKDFKLNKGQNFKVQEVTISTAALKEAQIQMFQTDSIWMIKSTFPIQLMKMANQEMSSLDSGMVAPLELRTIYQWESGSFVIRSILENVQPILEPEPDEKLAKDYLDGVKISIWDDKGKKLKTGYFHKVNRNPEWMEFEYEGSTYHFTYGPKAETLPFALHLSDFQLERYPGSTSPSSYASEVIVHDNGNQWPFRIFMNNVLDHGGYRFYQSSYDSDEKGTVLAINQDRPGTYITYLGYFLLALGMIWALFAPGSRFQFLMKKLGKPDKKVAIIILMMCSLIANAQKDTIPSWFVPKEKAQEYGTLIVQDLDGRMKPINTLANEIVRKIYGKTQISVTTASGTVSLTPEQFLLAVQLAPQHWTSMPIIKVDRKKGGDVFTFLDQEPVSHLRFEDFTTDKGAYKLLSLVEEANKLKPSERTEWHNEILKIDERFNIFYGLLTGDFLRIFPNRLDPNNTWFTTNQFNEGFEEEDANFVKNISGIYLARLREGIATGKWKEADDVFHYIDLYQRKAGANVYPTQTRIDAELLYNKINLGNRLFALFWLLGSILLTVAIILLFKQNRLLQLIWAIGSGLALIGWLTFTFHLGLRWFIAEHPPWSDGFEMLVFVAWGVLLFGLAFSRKTRFTIPLALLFSGTLLFVSFLDWLNPEITNLMPVLNSYWLKIHVAIIVSGYAPLALSAVLGLMSLLFLIFKPNNPRAIWWKAQKELITVNELSITIGLFLLAIGTFLGGVWANESWGRYWAWDPKETWALISVLVYALILHLRLVPATKSAIIYILASLWGFSSIIMTSFGVNYYLSGLHSYAKGDSVPIPAWVYWTVGFLFLVSIFAIISFQKLKPAEKKALVF
ncbi:cytochrome c biogenesis protein CcsA [Muricauda sp. SCSIO 64092]|uniref:cytochrome c biogenesis protein n=1 Tax=Allomuricauda sp. SCSIO 64092 TaxID=2908842 RepID=UPI001FF68ECD|nr:cytochrome c biogenesis protein CcsA [Muricauda sp. SCSIO 64092]UOY09053.1 cytochrome c biogenesis protein CcsA [Muricauda sp. SCSIO 64092]